MKPILLLAGILLAAAPAQTITFSDGSQARAYAHCGDMDLCATIAYTNGQTLSIYSEGAAAGQPYTLHAVLTDGTRTVFEFSRVIDWGPRGAELTLDHGDIHLDVTQDRDGTLDFTFAPASPPG